MINPSEAPKGLIAVSGNGCEECYFYDQFVITDSCAFPWCDKDYRRDEMKVIFIKDIKNEQN